MAVFSLRAAADAMARVLGVLGLGGGLHRFLLFTRIPPPAPAVFPGAGRRRDLNPLLQDPGLIFHPHALHGLRGLRWPSPSPSPP